MKKVRISIEEVLTYRRSMIIKVPEDMSETELNRLLDNAQREADSASDLPYVFENLNPRIKILEVPETNLSSPSDVEVEIDDLVFINDKVSE